MSIFRFIQEKITPKPVSNRPNIFAHKHEQFREFKNFSNSYRIGIIAYFTDYHMQDVISDYKKKLEQMGFECDVLLFVDTEQKEKKIYLPYFDWNDLDKKTFLPHSPKTDRFIVKKYDVLLNLYFQDCLPLLYLSKMSHAKCRAGVYNEWLKEVSDILIPLENEHNIENLIIEINKSLTLKPYARKQT